MAQPATGKLLVGGNAGFNVTTVDGGDNLFVLGLTPNVAKFINDNVAVGGSIGLTYQKSGDFSTTDLTLFPLVRYYFTGSNESMAFYLDGRAGVRIIGVGFDGDSESETAFTFAFGPGIAFFLTDNVSLDLGLTYTRTAGEFDLNEIAFNLGFQVWMPGKQDE